MGFVTVQSSLLILARGEGGYWILSWAPLYEALEFGLFASTFRENDCINAWFSFSLSCKVSVQSTTYR